MLTVNDALLQMLGYDSAESLQAANPNGNSQLFHDKEAYKNINALLKEHGHFENVIVDMVTATGDVIKTSMNAWIVHNDIEKVITGFIADISEQEQSRRKTLEAQALLQNIIDVIPQSIY